jgi:radical SAM superfamily enzyme YgiQ (UPF0313 family)
VYPNQTHLDELSSRWKYPNVRPRYNPIVQLGLSYLYSVTKKYHTAYYIDNNLRKLKDQALFQWIIDRRPEVVGFGGTLSEWPQASTVAAMLREKNITTIYGGSNATANPEKHVKYFDFVMRGYAEESFLGFLHGFRQHVPGLCWSGHIVNPCLLLDSKTLNETLPYRSRTLLNMYRRSDASICPSPVDVVMSSRGCPFACRFCSSKSIWGQRYLERDIDSVIDEVLYMKETHGTKTIHFREDNFTVNKKRLATLCAAMHATGLKWICQSRLKSLDKDTIHMMKSCGCVLVCIGFESANDFTLEYLNKGHTLADILRVVKILETEKLHYSGGLMAGVLNEGEDEIKNTLEFAKWLNKQSHSFVPRGAGRFVGFPVSETYHEMLNDGLVEYNWQDGELLIPNTRKLSAQQVEQCFDKWW